MNFRLAAFALLAPLVFSGCATVFTGETQNLALDTRTTGGEALAQADCVLKNDRGSWKARSPAQVQVRRSDGDLMVECQKSGFDAGFARVVSRVHSMFVADALLWGVGALVDHATGSAYHYPEQLSIKMGTSLVIDKRDQSPENETASQVQDSQPVSRYLCCVGDTTPR
jgi:hypothetical protein